MKKALPCLAAFLPFILSAQVEDFSCQKGHRQDPALKSHAAGPNIQALNSRSDTMDILHTIVNLDITDFTTDTIRGNAAIRFTPKMNGIGTLSLDLLRMSIDSVNVNSTNVTYSYNDTLLILVLPAPMNIGDTSVATVYYHGRPKQDAMWGGFYYQSGYAYNMGVGFASDPHNFGRVWFPCFDNFVERCTYQFNITSGNGRIAYCNGVLAKDTTIGPNRIRTWNMNETIPSYLACVSVSTYTQVNWSFNGINGNIPIVLAAIPGDTANLKNSFANLKNALTGFENRWGPYRWDKVGYTLVPFSSGAMEHATAIHYPRLAANGSLTYEANLMAHELSHHWFGDLVTCSTAGDMWLNEGWATYNQAVFTEWVYGSNAYKNYVKANHEDVLHYCHIRDGGIYRAISGIPSQYTYGDHVYNKGADVAHTLRGYLGDSLFFLGMKYYLNKNQFSHASSDTLKNDMQTSTGQNLSDFFNDWVYAPGFPHFSVDSFTVSPNGSNYDVTTYIRQKLDSAPAYYNNVPMEITFKNSAFTEVVKTAMMSGPATTVMFTIPIDPVYVGLNLGGKISDAITSDTKVIKTTGTSFATASNGRMSVTVQAITANDSAFLRIEHNWVAPDPKKWFGIPYRLSPNHYWKVSGILPPLFDATANISYDGRTSGTSGGLFWMDNNLPALPEDSIALLYRKNTADDWSLFPYYTKLQGVLTDKLGTIRIDSLLLGEYSLGVKDYTQGIAPGGTTGSQVAVYPNPASTTVNVDLSGSSFTGKFSLVIVDVTGQELFSKQYIAERNIKIDVSAWANGIYFLQAGTADNTIGRSKLVLAR